jgi:hypothetical protein
MPVGSEVARLKRSVDELYANVTADKRAKQPMALAERRALKLEIEQCMQKLDELRTMLTGD